MIDASGAPHEAPANESSGLDIWADPLAKQPVPQSRDHENSRWAVIAGIVLFVAGVLFVLGGLQFAIQGLAHGADSGGVREAVTGFGAVLLVVGIAHVYAAILISAHRAAGRSLGILIGAIGTLLGAIVFAVALRGALNPDPGSGDPNLIGLYFPVPHLAVLVGLIVGRAHFPRQ